MTLLELQLKPLVADQLEQVVSLDKICFGGLWSLDGYQRELSSPNSTLLVISVTKNNEPSSIIGIGCFWAILDEAHITILAVHPDYQGRGMGQLLLCALLKDAIGRKLKRATLEVRESNLVALSLYRKFGFKTAGKRKRYYPKTGEDALILWRGDLDQSEFIRDLKIWRDRVDKRLRQNQWKIVM